MIKIGSFDNFAVIMFLFFLSILGWSAELFKYMATEILTGITSDHSTWIYSTMLESFNILITFLRSSYLYLIIALLIVNALIQAGTKLNPIWFGISTLVFFILIYFLETYIMGPLILGLSGLDIAGQVHTDWFSMLDSLWLPASIGAFIGTMFAYVKGVRGGGNQYGINF